MNFANFVFALHDTSGIAKYGNEGGGVRAYSVKRPLILFFFKFKGERKGFKHQFY